ncbi:MAG TPA: EAL domain-containing protein [Actinomycetota bacterium]|jgi:EAL domain-containing protein (putative c-di-GMP-specific phosphodiesterase class I)
MTNPGAHDQIRIELDPIVELVGGRTVGFEARPGIGGDPSAHAVLWRSAARELGLHADLESRIAVRAIPMLAELPPDTYLALAVSPEAVLSPSYRSLLATGPLDRLVLEMGEHRAIRNWEQLDVAMRPLRAAGMRLGLTDVGIGHAALEVALRLRPELMKIAPSVVRGIESDSARQFGVLSLVAFASDYRVSLVAGDVQTPEAQQALAELGVAFGQRLRGGAPSTPSAPAPAGSAIAA